MIYSDHNQLHKRRRVFRIKFYLFLFLISLVIFGFYYLVAVSSLFKIKSVLVENNKHLASVDIKKELEVIVLSGKIGEFLGSDNMFSWPAGTILMANPSLISMDVTKDWFRRIIKIEAHERERFAIWCIKDKQYCYWIDKQGMAFAEAPLTEGSLVPVVFDSRTDDLVLGSLVEEERFSRNLISILENLNKIDFEPIKIIFDNSLQELRINTIEGVIIYFSDRFDSAKNIALIKNLSSQKLEYIDLRVENKIFYKIKK